MAFTDPVSLVPRHTDDIRMRFMAYIVPDSLVKSVSILPSESCEATHINSDIRSLQVRNRDRSWKSEALECDIFILDYYWLPKEYFMTSAADATGYGQQWFLEKGQVVQMLSKDRVANANVKAVLLPNDAHGMFYGMYIAAKDTLAEKHGIQAKLLDEESARLYHPLVIATLRAEHETNWTSLKPNSNVYHRYEMAHSRKYLNTDYPFMLVYSSARSTLQDTKNFLKSLY